MANQYTARPTSLGDRFMKSVSPEPMSGCWLWGAYSDKGGYGEFWMTNKTWKAHRASWEIFKGSIPSCVMSCRAKSCQECKLVLHKCDTPACVNPDHLFLGTPKDNTDDMCRKGRHGSRGKAA